MKVKCKSCGIDLTGDLVEVHGNGELKEIAGQDFVNRGKFFRNDSGYYTGRETQIVINVGDLINAKDHPDPSRLSGCCGPAGLDGLNKVCLNGHEVATEISDCWIAHAVIFDDEKINTFNTFTILSEEKSPIRRLLIK